jgi:GntP family gluconate:H+ symporter
MYALLILGVGVAIVVGGILGFRLHAFLALLIAAIAVTALTPKDVRMRYELLQVAVDAKPFPAEGGDDLANGAMQEWQFDVSAARQYTGTRFHYVRFDGVEPIVIGDVVVDRVEELEVDDELARLTIAKGVDEPLEVDASNIFVHVDDWVKAEKACAATIGERVASAFGATCVKIGILIALAAIIGVCLLESGAADRIVRSAMSVCGEKGAPFAFVGSGFLLGIPVFFDTVFYLMIPLGKAMRVRTGRNYLLYILTIVAGGTMAHSLVPPTPGPLLVAGELKVDLGLMIGLGMVVGLVASSAGMAFAYWANARNEVPLRESGEFSLADLKKQLNRDDSQLPPLSLSMLPILLPVIFIAGSTMYKQLGGATDGLLWLWISTLGNKNIALAIAAAGALLLATKFRASERSMRDTIQGALSSGGVIILITAAGGAFGATMKQTGVADLLSTPDGSPIKLLVIAFLITAAIRTAQGSATVAMITAVGILGAFADPALLGCHPVYLALAIGCGSKPVAWMADSGFWVICKMSGMTEGEGLRYISPLSIIMGLAGLAATLTLASLFPMLAQ